MTRALWTIFPKSQFVEETGNGSLWTIDDFGCLEKLEAKGLLSSISVFESDSIPECKYNTMNGGTSVEILQV